MLEIAAPLSGVILPLESVPDSVFAARLVGDGVAIDPTSSEVLAPIAGRVTQLHAARHAVAITSADGVEVLVHVGLDTVLLRGEGFEALVAPGVEVQRGQPLLRFDADRVARTARSLLTEVLVTNVDRVASMRPSEGMMVAGRTIALRVELKAAEAPAPLPSERESDSAVVLSAPVSLPNALGLHARPAAVLADEARRYAADLRVVRGADEANAKSVVGLLGLATQRGDVLRIKGRGADAGLAVERLAALLASGCGEPIVPLALASDGNGPVAVPAAARGPVPASPSPRPPLVSLPPTQPPPEMTGVGAAPGLAVGQLVQLRRGAHDEVTEKGGTPAEERARLQAALRESALQIEALRRSAGGSARAGILGVQLSLLEDPDLEETARALLAEGKSAAFAWREAYRRQSDRLEQSAVPLLRERAADVRDVGARVLGCLGGSAAVAPALPAGAIVVAEEITPSEMVAFEHARVAGVCTTTGSSTSHLAILARSMGLPAVCGIDASALQVADGVMAVIDGGRGLLRLRPDAQELERVRELMLVQEARRAAESAAAGAPAQTRDGHRVRVAANITSEEDARRAIAGGAEGVGLLRSEFLFVDRPAAPSEDEQAEAITAIAAALGDQPLVVRTLDVGGDKPISYLPLPREQNPFLGLRGIRVSLDRPDLLRTQLRAMLRAAATTAIPGGNRLHIMFPMVSGLEEVRAARAILDEVRGASGPRVEVGVMIEVPSAVMLAEHLAREVDFFSIGTNDLTQYTLAMDRGHPMLARQADALHPAVLRMIATTVEGAHRHGRWVGVCGGIASEPLAVPVLVGLGVDELSVSVPAIASVKAALSRFRRSECEVAAAHALTLPTVAEVRAYLASVSAQTEPAGQGSPRRAGKLVAEA